MLLELLAIDQNTPMVKQMFSTKKSTHLVTLILLKVRVVCNHTSDPNFATNMLLILNLLYFTNSPNETEGRGKGVWGGI